MPITLEQAKAVVDEALAYFPEPVRESLEDVEFIATENVAEVQKVIRAELEGSDDFVLDPSAKGVFVGEQMTFVEDGNPDEGEDAEPDEYPEGYIILVTPNIEDVNECAHVLMHEIGHALGLDEDGITALGLGGHNTSEAPANVTPAAAERQPGS